MKKTTKILAIILVMAITFTSLMTPVLAASPAAKSKITLNGQNMAWTLDPFLAYGPLGNVMILLPMRDLFTSLGYTVAYESKLNRSIFTADKNSDYVSFYIDINTGQLVKESEEIKPNALNRVYLINNYLYITEFELKSMAKEFLGDASVEVDYVVNKSVTREHYIIRYNDKFTIQCNLSSLTIEAYGKSSGRPYVGEQFTRYNTGEYILGAEVRLGLNEAVLKNLWSGFDDLYFYTGKGEQNELTGKGAWNSTMYAIAWEIMDEAAKEINKLRKQNGLSELAVDHSLCFVSVGAKGPKVDSVFDNAIHNIENNKAAHTYSGKSKMAECIASGILRGAANNSTQAIAANIVERWYKSTKGHKEIIMGKKYTTMGILVVITDTGTGDAYAVFK